MAIPVSMQGVLYSNKREAGFAFDSANGQASPDPLAEDDLQYDAPTMDSQYDAPPRPDATAESSVVAVPAASKPVVKNKRKK